MNRIPYHLSQPSYPEKDWLSGCATMLADGSLFTAGGIIAVKLDDTASKLQALSEANKQKR